MKPAPVVTSLHTGAAALPTTKGKGDWRKIPKAKRAVRFYQPHFHGVHGKPKLRWLKPLARSSNNKMTSLINKREEVDTTLLSRSQRTLELGALSAKDWLPRKPSLGKPDVLAKRRLPRLRSRIKAMNETGKLYRWDSSTERATELDLTSSLLWKSKRPLGPHLEDRERPLKDGEKEADHAAASSPGPEDDGKHPIDNLDGAFDDLVRAQSTKRKLADGPAGLKREQVQRKKAKKEQAANKKYQTATFAPKSESDQTDTSTTLDREADSIGESTPIQSMSQSKRSKVNAVSNKETAVEGNKAKVNGTTINGNKGSDRDLINGSKAHGGKVNGETTRAIYDESAVEPWYRIHARRMAKPGFDDFVRNRPGPPRPVRKKYTMSGAIPVSSHKFGSGALPTPPESSSSSSCSPDREKRVDNPQKEPNSDFKIKDRAQRLHPTKDKKKGAKALNGP